MNQTFLKERGIAKIPVVSFHRAGFSNHERGTS